MTNEDETAPGFWRKVVTVRDSALPRVAGRTLAFAAFGVAVVVVDACIHPHLGVEITPFEFAGGVLGMLLVLRTNAGYERWWEARKLWGGIANQSRNLAVIALTVGPDDPDWRDRVVRWTIAFAHVARRQLRDERELPEVARLVGAEAAGQIASAQHMPGLAALRLGEVLREGLGSNVAWLEADRERCSLVEHVGGCERILRSPLPLVYGIEIRRFLAVFLGTLPFALLDRVQPALDPIITLLVAYPLLALDQIGMELQDPFNPQNLGRLPLDEFTATIERDLTALREASLAPQLQVRRTERT